MSTIPETDNLATLEKDLTITIGYCHQCQRLFRESERLKSNEYLQSKSKAIEFAGTIVGDARKYERNPCPGFPGKTKVTLDSSLGILEEMYTHCSKVVSQIVSDIEKSEVKEDDPSAFLGYLFKRSANLVSGTLNQPKVKAIIKDLEQTNKAAKGLASDIRDSANEFVAYCRGVSEPRRECSEYRSKLNNAKRELVKLMG